MSKAPGPVPVTTLIVPKIGWFPDLGEVVARRGLLAILARREIRVRYRQTALGVAWVVLQPLLTSLVFIFVFGRVARLGSDGLPYLPFALSGIVVYLAFSATVSRASSSLVAHSSLVTKVHLPRILLPTAVLIASLVDLGVGLTVLVVVAAAHGLLPSVAILLTPFPVLFLCCLTLGVSWITSSLMVRFRDVQHIVPVLLQVLLYVSPVAYGVTNVPESVRGLYSLNPMVGILDAMRWTTLGAPVREPWRVGWAFGLSLGICLIGAAVFARRDHGFADVI